MNFKPILTAALALALCAPFARADNEDMPLPGDVQTAPPPKAPRSAKPNPLAAMNKEQAAKPRPAAKKPSTAKSAGTPGKTTTKAKTTGKKVHKKTTRSAKAAKAPQQQIRKPSGKTRARPAIRIVKHKASARATHTVMTKKPVVKKMMAGSGKKRTAKGKVRK